MTDPYSGGDPQVLGALPTVAFYAEIFYTPDDRLVLCEIVYRAAASLSWSISMR